MTKSAESTSSSPHSDVDTPSSRLGNSVHSMEVAGLSKVHVEPPPRATPNNRGDEDALAVAATAMANVNQRAAAVRPGMVARKNDTACARVVFLWSRRFCDDDESRGVVESSRVSRVESSRVERAGIMVHVRVDTSSDLTCSVPLC